MNDSSSENAEEAFVYHEDTGTYRTTCTLTESVSTTLLMLVSRVDELSTDELPPLNDVIDPDALDSIFLPKEDGVARGGGTVSFVYGGYDVKLHADGELVLQERGYSED